jgi:hypothetical protein
MKLQLVVEPQRYRQISKGKVKKTKQNVSIHQPNTALLFGRWAPHTGNGERGGTQRLRKTRSAEKKQGLETDTTAKAPPLNDKPSSCPAF